MIALILSFLIIGSVHAADLVTIESLKCSGETFTNIEVEITYEGTPGESSFNKRVCKSIQGIESSTNNKPLITIKTTGEL